MVIVYFIITVAALWGIGFAIFGFESLATKVNSGDGAIGKIILKVVLGLVLFAALAGMMKGCTNNHGFDVEGVKRLN